MDAAHPSRDIRHLQTGPAALAVLALGAASCTGVPVTSPGASGTLRGSSGDATTMIGDGADSDDIAVYAGHGLASLGAGLVVNGHQGCLQRDACAGPEDLGASAEDARQKLGDVVHRGMKELALPCACGAVTIVCEEDGRAIEMFDFAHDRSPALLLVRIAAWLNAQRL